MSENDYLLAWYIYLGAAALGYLAGWQLTSGLWRWLREPIRLAGVILLFTPTLVDPEHGRYAPAVAIVALDVVFGAGSSLWQAVLDLAGVGVLALPVYLLFCVVRWVVQRRQRRRLEARSAEDEPTMAEQLDAVATGRREPTL